MACPNCGSNNSMKLSGEYKNCLQCGYEDYSTQTKPVYKSNGLHYKARYAGDVTSQAALDVDVYLNKKERETTSNPTITLQCPYDQRVMASTKTGPVSKYRCYAGHIIYLHNDEVGNFLWN